MSLSLRQPDPVQQVGVARVRANTIELRVELEKIELLPSVGGSFQIHECSIFIAKQGVIGRRIVASLSLASFFG